MKERVESLAEYFNKIVVEEELVKNGTYRDYRPLLEWSAENNIKKNCKNSWATASEKIISLCCNFVYSIFMINLIIYFILGFTKALNSENN